MEEDSQQKEEHSQGGKEYSQEGNKKIEGGGRSTVRERRNTSNGMILIPSK